MQLLQVICERITLSLFALVFAFVCIYVPQPHVAHAGGADGSATLFEQLVQSAIQLGTEAYTHISAIANTAVSTLTGNLWNKEYLLDGIGWALAKAIISRMSASIVNWINSGFQGSPAFITDLEGFLLDTADRTFGQILERMGGPFSFICAPFRLNVQIALEVSYASARGSGIPEPGACTLTGALANIENFIDGTQSFVDAGGWDAWFKITTNPMKYTPQGNLLEAQYQASARLVNARNQEIKFADFGQGFLSSKVCQTVEDESGGHQSCTVTTPGQTISSALNKTLGAGQDSLIAADEINEIIAALFGQLANQAITGAAGLLGLSPRTGYASGGGAYTSQLSQTSFTTDPQRLRTAIQESLDRELTYQVAAQDYQDRLRSYSNNLLNENVDRIAARDAADEIDETLADSQEYVTTLQDLLARFDAMQGNDVVVLQEIGDRYYNMPLHTETEIEGNIAFWETLLGQTR